MMRWNVRWLLAALIFPAGLSGQQSISIGGGGARIVKPAPAPVRSWRNTEGKEIKARLKGYDGVTAKLEMGGRIYPVRKDKLSTQDQAYLDAWLSRQPGALPQGQMPSLSDANLASAPKLDLRAVEKLVHAAVNRERLKINLGALAWNDQVAAIARSHSQDMAKRNFFSHFNPEGEDPSARGARQGWTKSKGGSTSADGSVSGLAENIGRIGRFHSLRREVENGRLKRVVFRWYTADQMAVQIVRGWLNSPEHRKNMLDPDRELAGIGLGTFREHIFITQNLF